MSTGAPKEIGTAVRYPAAALLCVNSADAEVFTPEGYRIDTTTPGDIYINQQTPMMFGYMTRIALTEMNVEWAFPNVYDGNNTLTLELFDSDGDDQGAVRVTVPPGFYTAPRLGKVLETILNANATVISVLGADAFGIQVGDQPCIGSVVPADAGQTRVASSSNFKLFIRDDSGSGGYFSILPYNNLVPGLPRLTDDLTNMMGWTPVLPPAGDLGYYNIYTGGFASMMRTPYIDIVSNRLTKNQNVRDNDSRKQGSKALLARVYLSNQEARPREITLTFSETEEDGLYPLEFSTDSAFGVKETTFRREFFFPKQIMWNNTENIDIVDLQVVDYKGNVLKYQPTAIVNNVELTQNNTSDFQFTLQVTEQ